MTLTSSQSSSMVFITLAIAMGLRIIPLPDDIALYNPDWVALVILYWCLAIPEKFGVGFAWLTGLFTDVLTGRLLGQYALAYCVIAFVCLKLHQRIRVFPASQQAIIVFFLLLLCQLLIFWTQSIRGTSLGLWSYCASSISGALFSPLVFMLIRKYRRQNRIR